MADSTGASTPVADSTGASTPVDEATMDDVELSSPRVDETDTNPETQSTPSRSSNAVSSVGSLPDTELQSRVSVPVSVRLQSFKSWGITKVKCARQSMNERLGKVTRTVDVEMAERIENLQEAQRTYQQIVTIAKRLSGQLRSFLETQRSLGDLFAEYGVRVPDDDLQTELVRGATMQRIVSRSGEALVAALDHFVENITTLLTKTMEDTFSKVRDYETCRIQYDAYRVDLEQLQAFCDANPNNTAKQAKLEAAHVQFEAQKAGFTTIRNELSVKLKFLDENKVGNYLYSVRVHTCVGEGCVCVGGGGNLCGKFFGARLISLALSYLFTGHSP